MAFALDLGALAHKLLELWVFGRLTKDLLLQPHAYPILRELLRVPVMGVQAPIESPRGQDGMGNTGELGAPWGGLAAWGLFSPVLGNSQFPSALLRMREGTCRIQQAESQSVGDRESTEHMNHSIMSIS